MAERPVVSVIIPSVGRERKLRALLTSLETARAQCSFPVETIVVCSGYSQAFLSQCGRLANRFIVADQMPRVSAARNAGAAAAHGRYLLFVDDDNTVDAMAVAGLHEAISRGKSCVVAPVMYLGSSPRQPWCVTVHRTPVLARTIFRRQVPDEAADLLPSDDFPNCFMVDAGDFRRIGGFDERRFPQHFEEADLCKRLVALTGKGVHCVPRATIWHHIGAGCARRLHIKDAYSAYQCARARGAFLGLYGTRIQWLFYLALGQWIFAAFYIVAALRGLGARRGFSAALSYLRGLRDGFNQGLSMRRAAVRLEPR